MIENITKLSTQNKIVLIAYYKGYRIYNNIVYNPKGKQISINDRNRRDYKRFSINVNNYLSGYRIKNVKVHRLIAYQKFGDKIFESGVEVRHLDGDQANNHEDNIAIGTHSDNMMDQPKEIRLQRSVKAATSNRRFTDDEMEHIRELNRQGVSYRQLMKEFDISSKGTLSYMINKKYKTKN